MLAAIRTRPAARAYSQPVAQPVRHAYFVPRNSLGSVPVYTDTRMHNKLCTLVRNVEGNVEKLAADLQHSLFPADAPEAARLRVAAVRSRHVVLTGGHYKKEVLEWLHARGF